MTTNRPDLTAEVRHGFYCHASSVVRSLVVLLAFAWLPALSGAEHRAAITIRADGTCAVRADSTQPRFQAEQQVKQWDRMKKMQEAAEDDDAPPKPPTPEKESKALSDEELTKKLRELLAEQNEQWAAGGESKLDTLEVTSNSVHSVTTRTYSSLEDLLKYPYLAWGQSGLNFESLRIEKGAEGRLKVTLTPYSGNPRWVKQAKQTWKATGMAAELRFELPGKVLTSGLPNTEGNATWVSIDPKKEETLDAAAKLYDAPTVITAELGGLKLDAPLDSKTLARHASGRSGGEPELPITDAGPGFAAEPMSVTVTTLHYFPEGQKYLKDARSALGYQQTGAAVHAKLFAPKGRTLQSVSGVRVLKAVDDKGRPLVPEKTGDDAADTMSYSLGGGGRGNSTRIQLSLPLPPADAQSIEQLDGEAVILTAGNWKEQTVPNVSATTTNEIDLASVIPGAKLTLKKVVRKKNQTTVEGEIKGPPAIRQIEIQGRTEGKANSNVQANDRSFTTKDGVATRKFMLNAYHYGGGDDEDAAGPLTIVVRFPEDQKRERVKFSLKGLDLF